MKALVLSGGGAKGAYQIGVIRGLGGGASCDHIYGTSVGAINGAGLSYLGAAATENLWKAIKGNSDIYKRRYISWMWSDGYHHFGPLEKAANKYIGGVFRTSLTVTKVSYRTGEIKYCCNRERKPEEFRKDIIASSVIPFFMSSVDGWVDGGVREQIPILKAIQDGHKDITVILTSPIKDNPSPWKPSFPKIVSSGLRAVDIQSHETFLNDLKYCCASSGVTVKVFAPKEDFMDTMEFNPDKIKRAIDEGYKDATNQPNYL